jgi:hypothetical protein
VAAWTTITTTVITIIIIIIIIIIQNRILQGQIIYDIKYKYIYNIKYKTDSWKYVKLGTFSPLLFTEKLGKDGHSSISAASRLSPVPRTLVFCRTTVWEPLF